MAERTTGFGNVVPRLLLGAVDGLGTIAIGALDLARNVTLVAVSGAANIGAEALSATVAGTRGIVVAASSMVGEVAGSAQRTVMATVDDMRRPGGRARRPAARMEARGDEKSTPARPSAARGGKRMRRRRSGLRAVRPSVAA